MSNNIKDKIKRLNEEYEKKKQISMIEEILERNKEQFKKMSEAGIKSEEIKKKIYHIQNKIYMLEQKEISVKDILDIDKYKLEIKSLKEDLDKLYSENRDNKSDYWNAKNYYEGYKKILENLKNKYKSKFNEEPEIKLGE